MGIQMSKDLASIFPHSTPAFPLYTRAQISTYDTPSHLYFVNLPSMCPSSPIARVVELKTSQGSCSLRLSTRYALRRHFMVSLWSNYFVSNAVNLLGSPGQRELRTEEKHLLSVTWHGRVFACLWEDGSIQILSPSAWDSFSILSGSRPCH